MSDTYPIIQMSCLLVCPTQWWLATCIANGIQLTTHQSSHTSLLQPPREVKEKLRRRSRPSNLAAKEYPIPSLETTTRFIRDKTIPSRSLRNNNNNPSSRSLRFSLSLSLVPLKELGVRKLQPYRRRSNCRCRRPPVTTQFHWVRFLGLRILSENIACLIRYFDEPTNSH